MKKKKVMIISHSHWDREWYMAYEQHHMRLIELIDDLLELVETDPEFNSFHLDGQTIILDDYLQVRPEKRGILQKAISAGKLQIGPFYILQDDFLISAESNTRNMLIGFEESKKWGQPVLLGYFPDTFGNMGQTPQMMRQANLESAAFGRGVKPIGFDNEVLEDNHFTSQYSEMHWQGPDGSEIFGLLFANWYSNGNEIPTEPKAAKLFWQQKLADAEKFASTNYLLMMNGVDHQPVQKDITAAIRLANELFPEYEFVHSNFNEYLKVVKEELPQNLATVKGELTSQETDGWYTLANTASTRVYLKQWNTKVSRQLENIAEPLAAMAYEVTGKYPFDQLDYAWKTLLQNHPHDSICGCSVDDVHREMMTRFEKANEVGKYIADEALDQLIAAINPTDFPENSKPFVVFNTTGMAKSGIAEIEVELERKTFAQGAPQRLYRELKERPQSHYFVVDQTGEKIPATVSLEEVLFDYELPKDAFRVPFMKRFVKVALACDQMPPFSWQTFALVCEEGVSNKSQKPQAIKRIVSQNGRRLENDAVLVEITADGSLAITDKQSGKVFNDLLTFEDAGDIGNEYIFKQPEKERAIYSTGVSHEVEIIENSDICGKVRLTQQLMIPKSADECLEEEQKAVVEFRHRKAKRSKELIELTLTTTICVEGASKRVSFETCLDNQAKDHRLRVLFPTGLRVATHEADSIYEVVTRPNKVTDNWENPTNPQHQHAFVNMHDSTCGMTVSNFGLNEYEIVEGTICLTLLRCVGELGDWGYFPTPEAQCLGTHSFHYGIELHGAPKTRFATYKNAQTSQVPFSSKQLVQREDSSMKQVNNLRKSGLPLAKQYIEITGDTFAVTALKRRKEDQSLVLRGYNLADEKQSVLLSKDGKTTVQRLNLLEEEQGTDILSELVPFEICTIAFKEE